MSQSLAARKEPSKIIAPILPRRSLLSRGGRPCLTNSVLHILWIGLWLIAVPTTARAQQAQTIKSATRIECDARSLQLRLVAAEAPINAKNATALGIVLTPQDAADSKVFS